MNGNFAAKFFRACAFLYVHSLAGKIFLFKTVKMVLTNSGRKKSPVFRPIKVQIHLNQLYQQIHFNQIKSKMAANNVSNTHVSLDVHSTLMLLQQGNLYNLQQQILHEISRSSRLGVLQKSCF